MSRVETDEYILTTLLLFDATERNKIVHNNLKYGSINTWGHPQTMSPISNKNGTLPQNMKVAVFAMVQGQIKSESPRI